MQKLRVFEVRVDPYITKPGRLGMTTSCGYEICKTIIETILI